MESVAVYARDNRQSLPSSLPGDTLNLENLSRGSLLRRKSYYVNRADALEAFGRKMDAAESMRKAIQVIERLRREHGYKIDEKEMKSLYEFCAVSFMDSGFEQMKEYGSLDEKLGKSARCFRLAAELLEESLRYSEHSDESGTRRTISYLHEGSAILYRARARQLSKSRKVRMPRMMYSCAARQFGIAAGFAVDQKEKERLLKSEEETKRERRDYISSLPRRAARMLAAWNIFIAGIEEDMNIIIEKPHTHEFNTGECNDTKVINLDSGTTRNLTKEEIEKQRLEDMFDHLIYKSDDHLAHAWRTPDVENALGFAAYDCLMALRIMQKSNPGQLIDSIHYEKALKQLTEALLELAEFLEKKNGSKPLSRARFARSLVAKYNNVLALEYERVARDRLRKGNKEKSEAYLHEAMLLRIRFRSLSANAVFARVFRK